jgi:predicted metalloprotease with PDZ domain
LRRPDARRLRLAAIAALALVALWPVRAAEPVHYYITIPEPEHHWMQVEATFPDLGNAPLELRMSDTSPGRYALHEFAKNVYDVHVFGRDGAEVAPTRTDPSGWLVARHGGSAMARYKVFGDRVDGTYLAIDATHLHMNMPAALMWARGLEDRPAVLTLTAPLGARWQVATQLHPGGTQLEYTAPNLQYLMDSPVEFGPLALRQFVVDNHTFRFALHHLGTDAELDGFVKDVERIVQQEEQVFGEYPPYEPGRYTFIVDYLPWANGDGMEHRNSTVITSAASIATAGRGLLDTVAHEFFHNWNIERIRPASLEPFDFTRADMSGELWLGEGFTQYYAPLTLQRAGLADLADALRAFDVFVNLVEFAPGRQARSAVQMSRMAPFTDGGRPIDPTNWSNTYISYYPYGGAIAMALDLTLRERSGGSVTLDDFMRTMWTVYGKPGGSREGYVDHPYTIEDAQARLGDVAGDRELARDFFARYVTGRESPDFGALLAPAGLVLQPVAPGRAWLGDLRLDGRDGLRVGTLVAPDAPVYRSGLEEGDLLNALDGKEVRTPADVAAVLDAHKPGDRIDVTYTDRRAQPITANVVLGEDPHVTIVPVERAGGQLTPEQAAFRAAWLGAR